MAAMEKKCHPHHWIFFYGSCISSVSRKATGITGACFPCKVHGFTRHWALRVDLDAKGLVVNKGITGVTAVTCVSCTGDGGAMSAGEGQGDAACTNGVLVRVPESEISSFDKREVNYSRKRIARGNLVPLRRPREDNAVSTYLSEPEAPCWIYVAQPEACLAPTSKFPIIQSYLDVMLLGCREHGEDFAAEFCLSTFEPLPSQSGHRFCTGFWIDDRDAPGYVRHSEEAAALGEENDAILARTVPEALAKRVKFGVD